VRSVSGQRCALLNLGGTIGEIYDGGGLEKRLSASMLLAAAGLSRDWTGHDVAPLDSVDITFDALELASNIIARDRASMGFIMCCGTDLLEEIAYAASLLLPSDRPIVFTAAASPASEPGADGPANLRRAAALISSGLVVGTVIVMGDEIFSPAGTVKIEPQAMQPFAARNGQIGRFRGGSPSLYGSPDQDDRFRILAARHCRARVAILNEYMGGTDVFVDPSDLDGLIVASAGAGGLSRRTHAMLLARYLPTMPVVLSTRCPFGYDVNPNIPKYALAAASADGFLIQGYSQLNAVQARIRLILEIGLSIQETSNHARRPLS
jgi:L-asparaginase